MQEKELFQNYELKNWEFSPRVYKILGASAIVNILLVIGLAQANFLTARSCDTPIVSGVCSVLDALYVGTMMADTDMGFVSEEYQKTELEDADITFLDLTGQTPPLEYPDGYFAIANPESVMNDPMVTNEFAQQNPTMGYIPGIPTNPTFNNSTTDLITKPQVTPIPNKNPVIGKLPTGNNPTVSRNNRNRVTKTNPTTTKNNQSSTTTENPTTAQTENQNQKVESKPVKEIGEINKKPFEDLGDSLNDKIAKNEIDLNKNFLVMMDGTLTADGRLDKNSSRYVKSEGDEQMIIVAKEAIEAIGDSGFLAYLKNYGVDKANLTLRQDDTQIYILLVSDQKDANKANTTASGFNTMLQGLLLLDKNGIKKLDENSRLLVNNAKVTSDGKNFVLSVTIPKTDAQAMINKTLKNRAEKKAKETNSNVESSSNTDAKTTK